SIQVAKFTMPLHYAVLDLISER
ncbi:hypothetical protein, partial [Yersinia enterocolitica]